MILFICLILFLVSLFLTTVFVKKGMNCKKAIAIQIASFIAIMALAVISPIKVSASAKETTSTTQTSAQDSKDSLAKGMGYLGMAIVMGLASLGTGKAVASAAPAAIGATSEDPKAFGKAMVFVGLAEGVAVFGLLIAILIFVLIQ